MEGVTLICFPLFIWPVGRPFHRSQKFRRFSILVIICLEPCGIDYFSCSASVLSSYSDQIAGGQTTTQALLTSPLAHPDYPQTRVRQHKIAWLPPDRGLLPHNMDGSDGALGFELTENPTLYHPTQCLFSFILSFFLFLNNILLPSNICILGYSLLNEVSRPLVSLKKRSQAPFYLGMLSCLSQMLKSDLILELIKKKKKWISCFSCQLQLHR